jgi:hypothetical protein
MWQTMEGHFLPQLHVFIYNLGKTTPGCHQFADKLCKIMSVQFAVMQNKMQIRILTVMEAAFGRLHQRWAAAGPSLWMPS